MALPSPVSHIIVDGHEVELFRCSTDGGLLFSTKEYDSAALFQAHSGHRMKQPVILKDGELQEIFDELGIQEMKSGN